MFIVSFLLISGALLYLLLKPPVPSREGEPAPARHSWMKRRILVRIAARSDQSRLAAVRANVNSNSVEYEAKSHV